jgi:hypothetical protein
MDIELVLLTTFVCKNMFCHFSDHYSVSLDTGSLKIVVTLLKEILGEKFGGNSCLILILIVSCVFVLWCVNQMKPSVSKITFQAHVFFPECHIFCCCSD